MSARGARARAIAFAQWQHEQRRDASPIDHSDEIADLEHVLAGDLSPYSPIGIRTMRDRVLFLKAQAGLLPLRAAAE